MRKSKSEKETDKKVETAYKLHGQNVQIDIFDISNIYKAGHTAAASGQDVGAAVKEAIAKYRKN